MANPAKSLRLLKALEQYTTNHNRWDRLLFNKVKILDNPNGEMIGTFTVTKDITNVAKILHGGFIASIMDVFGVFGILSHRHGDYCLTTDMNISYLKMAGIGAEVKVHMKPLRVSKSRIVLQCLLSDEADGSPLAFGTIGLSVPNMRLVLNDIPFDVTDNST